MTQQRPLFPKHYPRKRLLAVLCGLLMLWGVYALASGELDHIEQIWLPAKCQVMHQDEHINDVGKVVVVVHLRRLNPPKPELKPRSVTWFRSFANSAEAHQATASIREGELRPCFLDPMASARKVANAPEVKLEDPRTGPELLMRVVLVIALLLIAIGVRLLLQRLEIKHRSVRAYSDQPVWPTRRRLSALAVFLGWGGVVALVGYGAWVQGEEFVRHGFDQDHWQVQDGRVVYSYRFTSKGSKNSTHYHWTLRVAYQVKGRDYITDQFRLRGDIPDSSSATQALVEAYPKGAAVPVYVDPDDPTRAVLERVFPVRFFIALIFLWLLTVAADPRVPWIRWAWRQLRPERPMARASSSGRTAGVFDIQRWHRPSPSMKGEHVLADGRVLRWDVETLALGDQRMRWDEASLHLSRAEPPMDDGLDRPSHRVLHLEFRATQARMRLQSNLDTRDHRLHGLPWLAQQGCDVPEDVVADLVALALLHEVPLAAWPEEALVHPDDRSRRRRRAASPLLLDTSARSRARFFWLLRLEGLVLSVFVALMASAAQPYPDEMLTGEIVFGTVSVVVLAVVARFMLVEWRRWRGDVPRVHLVAADQPTLGEAWTVTVAHRGGPGSVVVDQEVRCFEQRIVGKGKSSSTRTNNIWSAHAQVEVSADQPRAYAGWVLPVEGVGVCVDHNNVSLQWVLNTTFTVKGASHSLDRATRSLEVDPLPAEALADLDPAPGKVRTWSSDVITLRLHDAPEVWLPGQRVTGHVSWQASGMRLDRAELRLCPAFQNRPLEISERRVFDAPEIDDRRDIDLMLPTRPYSMSGDHVTVQWLLEVVLMPCDEVLRVILDVRPHEVDA